VTALAKHSVSRAYRYSTPAQKRLGTPNAAQAARSLFGRL